MGHTMPETQQCQIRATSATYTTVHQIQQHQILNPLSKARDRTRNLMVRSWIRFCCATMGNFYFELILISYFFVFLGKNLWHIQAPRLGVTWELQLPTYIIATAMPVPSHVCSLHHSSGQFWILNPLSEARY